MLISILYFAICNLDFGTQLYAYHHRHILDVWVGSKTLPIVIFSLPIFSHVASPWHPKANTTQQNGIMALFLEAHVSIFDCGSNPVQCNHYHCRQSHGNNGMCGLILPNMWIYKSHITFKLRCNITKQHQCNVKNIIADKAMEIITIITFFFW